MIKEIIFVVILVLIVISGYKGYEYYTTIYKGDVAYAKVPDGVPTVEDTGQVISGSKSYKYDFDFVKKDGTIQKMDYELSGNNVSPLQPGSYVKVFISQIRVISGPNDVSKSDIPKNILEKLDK